MSYINPLAAALPQATATQQQLGAEKTRQVRREAVQEQLLERDMDQLEHEVDGAEALTPVHDETPNRQSRKGKKGRKAQTTDEDEQPERIDVTA